MLRSERSLTRELCRPRWLVVPLGLATVMGAWACEPNRIRHFDAVSEPTPSEAGTSHTSMGGKSGASGSTNVPEGGAQTGAEGGSGDLPADYPEPSVDSMEPTSGPYGTLVTIKGQGLGNAALAGFTLAVGNQGEVTLTPKDKTSVMSWTDDEIIFRYPFPAEGGVSLEAPKGALMAGEFQPTWHIAQEIDIPPAATVLASISPAADHIEMLFDTMPLSLLDVGPDGATPHTVTAANVDPSSVRLFLNAAKKVEGVGVSTDAAPVIVALQNQSDDLVAKATTIKLAATEFGVAGGSEGAAVWMRRAAGWYRARPGGSGWAQDKGPIADPNADGPDRASGLTSDGSLFVAWSVDTGNFLDDMEAAHMKKLAPAAATFGTETAAGASVDDYVTGLTLKSSGDGLVVTTCGSDVDPFGLSGTDHYCYDSLHAPGGAHLFNVPLDEKAVVHAFTHERAVATYCTSDESWLIRTDVDVETTPGAAIGETVLYPCPEAIALEVNGAGDYLPVVRLAGKTYLLERNPNLPAK
jgi:hypothetical protein